MLRWALILLMTGTRSFRRKRKPLRFACCVKLWARSSSPEERRIGVVEEAWLGSSSSAASLKISSLVRRSGAAQELYCTRTLARVPAGVNPVQTSGDVSWGTQRFTASWTSAGFCATKSVTSYKYTLYLALHRRDSNIQYSEISVTQGFSSPLVLWVFNLFYNVFLISKALKARQNTPALTKLSLTVHGWAKRIQTDPQSSRICFSFGVFQRKGHTPGCAYFCRATCGFPPRQNHSWQLRLCLSPALPHPHIFPMSCPHFHIISDNDPAKITRWRLRSHHRETEWKRGFSQVGWCLPSSFPSWSWSSLLQHASLDFPSYLRATAPQHPQVQTHMFHCLYSEPSSPRLVWACSITWVTLQFPCPGCGVHFCSHSHQDKHLAMLRLCGSTAAVGSRPSRLGKIRMFHLPLLANRAGYRESRFPSPGWPPGSANKPINLPEVRAASCDWNKTGDCWKG